MIAEYKIRLDNCCSRGREENSRRRKRIAQAGQLTTMESSNKGGPKWLKKFVGVEYFTECSNCTKKCETRFFCVDCCKGPLCETERQAEHRSHRVLQVRKASGNFTVKVSDIMSLVNIDDINQYVINGAKIVFLPTRRHQDKPSSSGKAGAERYYCEMCHRVLMEPVKFCSVSCKMKSIVEHPSDSSVTLALGTGATSWSHTHSSSKEVSTTSGDINDVPHPPSPSPATPEKKRAKKRPRFSKRESTPLIVPERQLWEKMSIEVAHSPTSVLFGPAHQADIPDLSGGESSSLHASVQGYSSFRKRPRKSFPIRAPGVGIAPIAVL